MTAVVDLIQDAMFAAQIIGQDQTADAGDIQLSLRRLNRMLGTWANERSMMYVVSQDTFTMSPTVGQYLTSLLAGGRPTAILGGRTRLPGSGSGPLDYPFQMIDVNAWNRITYKPVPAIPSQCWYNPSMPDGLMNFYPTPYTSFTCFVDCQRPLTGALTLTTNVLLPEGYEAAIVAALAVDLAPSFGSKVTEGMMADRTHTRAVLRRINYKPQEMTVPHPRDSRRSGYLYLANTPW